MKKFRYFLLIALALFALSGSVFETVQTAVTFSVLTSALLTVGAANGWAGFVGASFLNVKGFMGSIPASSAGTFNTTYLPQFLGFTATTVPTNFQIEVNGQQMTFNLDGAGLNAMSHIRQQNRVANTYVFQLADGLINGVNCIWNITNAVAGVLNIYGWSPIKKGEVFWKYNRLAVLAGATVEVDDFAYLAAPSAAAADKFQVSYEDGSVDSLIRDEVNYHLGYTQGDLTSKYNIDNLNPARINRVYFTGVAAQTLYKLSYAER